MDALRSILDTRLTFEPPTADRTVLRLAEDWLRRDAPMVLAAEYPHALHAAGSCRLAVQRLGDRPTSFAVVREVTAITEGGAIGATLVGSVVTDPAQRGRGCASHLLRGIVEDAGQRGHDAVNLWSSEWGFYERLGFQPSGFQHELELGPARGHLAPGIRPAAAGDVVALWELHQRKPLRVERTLGDMALQLSTPSMHTFVLSRHGAAVAYACLGKGTDFPGWWHEVGGSDEDVAVLIRGATDVLGLAGCTVMLPAYRATLHNMLRRHASVDRTGACALRCALTAAGAAEFWIDGLDSI